MDRQSAPGVQVPPHGIETRPWRQRQRGGTREDRMFAQVAASIPPLIADIDLAVAGPDAALAERAVQAIARADALAGTGSAALGRFMIRTESIASSKIEHIAASGEDLARAIAGSRANASARSMVAAAAALQDLLLSVGRRGTIALEDLLGAHRLLMQDDDSPGDRAWAGVLRKDQNWIGGSDHSPRGALFVPPPPELVEPLLEDLIAFVNRQDMPVMVQAALAHGQFESIHPFTDGNGRIGRALVGAILQRRGATVNAAVPVASGLHALRREYFAALGHYRAGDLAPLLRVLSEASLAAAQESEISFDRLQQMPEQWKKEIGPGAAIAARELLDAVFEHPTLTAEDAMALVTASSATIYRTLDLLERRGILREVTGRRRDRIWVVADVVDELEDLDARIRARLA